MSRRSRADLAGVVLGDESPVAVMGVINVSPESFHAGSVYRGDDAVIAAALGMVEAGAALSDAGARSSAADLETARRAAEETHGLTALATAREAGVPVERVVLDPGIGFFRDADIAWHAWDVAVLAGLPALAGLGRPLCVGVSRKSFVGAITGRDDPAARLSGSLAATAAAVLGGAALIRTHDVAETVDAVRVAERVRRAAR